MPAWRASARTVSGSSPEMILTITPLSRNARRVLSASPRSSSRRATRPSGRMPSGSVIEASSPPPPSAGRALASGWVATRRTRRPRSVSGARRAVISSQPRVRARPPRPSRRCARDDRATRYGRRNCGAPSATIPGAPAANATALHFRCDENGTSPASGLSATGQRAAIASDVLFPAVAEAASAATASTTSSSVAPPSGTTSSTSSRFAVSVPVLSRHSTSTCDRLSIAFDCWTRAPKRSIRIAPSAYATAIDTNSPLGTSPARRVASATTSPTLAACTSPRSTSRISR